MDEKKALRCRESRGTLWVLCPVCRMEKVLKLGPETRATALTVFCRQCKHETVVDIEPGAAGEGQRVTLAALN